MLTHVRSIKTYQIRHRERITGIPEVRISETEKSRSFAYDPHAEDYAWGARSLRMTPFNARVSRASYLSPFSVLWMKVAVSSWRAFRAGVVM